MGAQENKVVKLSPKFDPKRNISFGGDLEKEMIETFNTFDILYYAPENSEKLDEWVAFINVIVTKVTKEGEFKTIALLGQMLRRYIIITSGKYGENIIPSIAQMLKINVIIYCMNVEHHKQWSKKYGRIQGVFSTPAQIFEYLLKLQKTGFDFPIFSYKIFSSEIFNFNYYDSLTKTEFILKENIFTLKLNKYERFLSGCIYEFKLAYSKFADFFDYFRSDTVDIIKLYYGQPVLDIPGMEFLLSGTIFDKPVKELNLFFIILTYISAYFSKYPYLYGLLSYDEIINLLEEDFEIDGLRNDYHEFLEKHSNDIMVKLTKEKASIIEEIGHLKFLQSFLIKHAKYIRKIVFKFGYDEYRKYPLLIKYFMDIDFCLKLYFCDIYELFKCKQYKIKAITSIKEDDKRLDIFENYIKSYFFKSTALKYISENDFQELDKTLKIKDFIVVGSTKFHKMIKSIENNFEDKNIDYINLYGLREYLIKKKNAKYRNFTYFLLIKEKKAEKIYKEIYTLKNEFGLKLYLIVYNRHIGKFINKRPFQIKSHLPLFIADNVNEIINFVNSQKYLNCGLNFSNATTDIIDKYQNFIEDNKIIIPKIEIKEEEANDKLASEDGWELVEKIPDIIFKQKILGSVENVFYLDNIKMQFFEMFKEKKIDFLFNGNYCKYFSFCLFPELTFSSINIPIKHFLYAYTLDEGPNSFYYLMNKDLRSGDYLKIKEYIDMIALINSSFKNNYIKSYEGQLFRGTKMENQYIEEKIKVGNILTNLSFWSASKERKIAERFLRNKNILFIIETKKNNIDIDIEQISKFPEKEVLFLPFSKFLVKSIGKIMFNKNEIFEVKLEGLDDSHERNKIEKVPMVNYIINSLQNK